MKKLKYYLGSIIIILSCCILSMSFSCHNDKDELQYNDYIIGTWEIENYPGEFIKFFPTDIFIMNDTIMGNYDIEEDNDKELWYYACDESDNEYEGIMYVSDIHYKKSICIKGLPTHEEENLKIIYRK